MFQWDTVWHFLFADPNHLFLLAAWQHCGSLSSPRLGVISRPFSRLNAHVALSHT